MIEISIHTIGVEVEAPTPEQIDQGAPEQIIAQIIGGSLLPIQDPGNPGHPMKFPAIAVNVPLTKEAALQLAKLLEEKAKQLPDGPSGKIIAASSLAEAENLARALSVDRT